ncbi:RpiB/LacA/LacB family sugar-phosphate isomerase [Candidatus Woesearchaeota archaeon]|nr:RpiB/LacA/LacB family sugar-phosphate isomerase [Candidatus Woesearchaeota archaeon]
MAEVIYIGADHAGFKLKEKVKRYLEKMGYEVKDMGNYKFELRDDFTDFAVKVSKNVVKTKSKGVLICGTGQGMCVAANKVKGTRAYYAYDKNTAEHAAKHGNANIICMPGYLKDKTAQEIVKTWLKTKFSKKKKYIRRIGKLKKIERMK